MASIKVKFRPSVATDREGTIYYQIIQDRKVRQHFTDYRVLNDEWDEKRAMVKCNPGMRRYKHLLGIRDGIKRDVSRLMRIISSYDNSGLPYTVEELVEEFILYNKEYTLFNFTETLIDRFIKNGKLRTAETYKA
ncbi:MAG: site-specific integrase, partial [Bacteroides sp.]|nr:site-specific integrase [Bacteroides sp.]